MRNKFIEVVPAAGAKPFRRPAIPEDICLLFVDWALEHYSRWCSNNRRPIAIVRAEAAFPGPFMRIVGNRRSFYYAWDCDQGRGTEIARRGYPRVAERDGTFTVVPAGPAWRETGSVRRMLSGQMAAGWSN